MQQRRRSAARLFAAGYLSQAEIARQLEVSRQSVSRWYEAWRSDQPGWISGTGRAGRRPHLNEAQLQQIDAALRRGALAHGFTTAPWTLSRVAAIIDRITGVRFHLGHVWKILAAMRWNLQRSERQTRELNHEAPQRWVKEHWPAVKRPPRKG